MRNINTIDTTDIAFNAGPEYTLVMLDDLIHTTQLQRKLAGIADGLVTVTEEIL